MGWDPRFDPFEKRMQAEGLPEIAIRTFAFYYHQLLAGYTGLIEEREIEPVKALPNAESFPDALHQIGENALSRLVLLKLNGGLGTSMGLYQAKSLLRIKGGLTFLDIIARQALATGVPLVLMNSFSTREDSLRALQPYPELFEGIPVDFLQHKVPKVSQRDLSPARWGPDPELTWAPPGHGDIYTALLTSGMLTTLLEAGYQYAFVSNADNLGAVANPALLGYFVENQLPFMMEVADRTPADRKGGHIALKRTGGFTLRELAQCPPGAVDAFQDITRYKYFNTNNLWIHLPALEEALRTQEGVLGLPLIRNQKTVDPRDAGSPRVFQLETAMGAAISRFPNAGAVRVPRSRFAPVKTTSDLLAIRSDIYDLSADHHVVPHPTHKLGAIDIQLDPSYYQHIDQLEARFPHGPPSLHACSFLSVRGDIKFGADITLAGSVEMVNKTDRQVEVPAGTVIKGNWDF